MKNQKTNASCQSTTCKPMIYSLWFFHSDTMGLRPSTKRVVWQAFNPFTPSDYANC